MRRFSDLNIPSDGRKMFNCPVVSITEIVNCEIEIHDFVVDMKTQHGEGRALIKAQLKGEEVKFFTNCKPLKDVLSAIGEEDLPFATTIKKIKNGNSICYKFT
jgi:hypothetical protein